MQLLQIPGAPTGGIKTEKGDSRKERDKNNRSREIHRKSSLDGWADDESFWGSASSCPVSSEGLARYTTSVSSALTNTHAN
jgi:hypothetical protein